MSEDVLAGFYWDVTFMGVEALDVARGITSTDRKLARGEETIIEHGNKVVVLCDSSKLGRYCLVKVGDVSVIDVLITDVGARPDMVSQLSDEGIDVILAGPPESAPDRRTRKRNGNGSGG